VKTSQTLGVVACRPTDGTQHKSGLVCTRQKRKNRHFTTQTKLSSYLAHLIGIWDTVMMGRIMMVLNSIKSGNLEEVTMFKHISKTSSIVRVSAPKIRRKPYCLVASPLEVSEQCIILTMSPQP